MARAGDTSRALSMLAEAIEAGFLCEAPLERDPWLAAVRDAEGFTEVRDRRAEVHRRFLNAGGLDLR